MYVHGFYGSYTFAWYVQSCGVVGVGGGWSLSWWGPEEGSVIAGSQASPGGGREPVWP
jgi:hypothetical protein